jgi:23S rRNA-/tRNA-specific pseudouridylate synthase
MLNIFQTQDFYFFRKPHWVASTFWKEKSFLDYIFLDNIDLPNNSINYENLDKDIFKYLNTEIESLNIVKSIDDRQKIIQNLINTFWEEKEYWLLNRLDNDTWGFLYFAKDIKVYEEYKNKQNQNLLHKFYIAQIKGNPFFKIDDKEINIDYPIMHHKFSEDRMICITKPWDTTKWDWKQHLSTTNISLLNFDKTQNISTLLISISKWIRHQIRLHLSSIWCPIIWETIYSKNKYDTFLHLRSIGFK